MDKKYKSTVEIHAEHLQRIKDHQKYHHLPAGVLSRCRSLSSNSTSSLVTVSSQQQLKKKKNPNRHQTALYIKHVPSQTTASNSIQNDLENNLEKSQKEIEYLRTLLTERNQLIEKQKKEQDFKQRELVKLNDAKLNDIKSNDQLLKQLEEQKQVILNLKSKLTKLNNQGNIESDAVSSISNNLDKTRQNVKKNIKKYDDRVDASVQVNAVIDTATNPSVDVISNSTTHKLNQQPATIEDITETSSLVCNIPEHHKLEDLLHENREYITKLKALIKSNTSMNPFDEMTLLEKKAEFEALDLAINTRKQQLYNLELTKNRKLSAQNPDDSTYSSNNSTNSSNNYQTVKVEYLI